MDFIPTAEKLLGVLGCGPGAACSCCLQATPWPLESWILPSELLLRSELLTCAAVVLPFCLRSVGQCVSLQSSAYHVTSPLQGALLPDLSPCPSLCWLWWDGSHGPQLLSAGLAPITGATFLPNCDPERWVRLGLSKSWS